MTPLKKKNIFYKNTISIVVGICALNTFVWLVLNMFVLKVSPDGHYYLSQAHLIELHGIKAFIQSNLATPYYTGFPVYLFVSHLIAGNSYFKLLLVVQFLISCILPLLLMRIYLKIFNDVKGSLILGLLYIICLDIAQWNNFLLTDLYSLFLSVLFVLIVLNVNKLNSAIIVCILTVCTVCLLSFRGSNILILIPSAIYLLTLGRKGQIAGGTIVICAICLSSLALIFNDHQNAFSLNARYHLFLKNLYNGEIIDDRSYYDIHRKLNDENAFFYFLKVLLYRALNYWRFYCQGFSITHNVYNGVYFPMCYLFALLCFYKNKLNGDVGPMKFIASIIVLYYICNCFTMIDYDWRYRVPALTFLLFFSARGMSLFATALTHRKSRMLRDF